MRSFSISKLDKYIIVENSNNFLFITSARLNRYYNINLKIFSTMQQLKQYNFTCLEYAWAALSFPTESDAQQFIDEVLIPHEIAFNLNGEQNEGI